MNNVEFEKMTENFGKLTVKHPKQIAALKHAMFLVTACPNVKFVVLAGLTGSGKSHLLQLLYRGINAHYAPHVAETPSMVPFLSTTAIADGAKKFGFKRLWRDGMVGLHDPFSDARAMRLAKDPKVTFQSESFTTAVAREQFEDELKLRGVRVWGIDEAQHILLGGVAGQPGDQFDVLKSVSQVTEAKLVLCGTQQLPHLLSYSSQVMRRSATVTLLPYSLEDTTEASQFASVCAALLKHLPCNSGIDAVQDVELLFYGSLGAVGVLKDWITRAWARSHFNGKSAMTKDDLVKTRLPAETLISMHEELVIAEELNSSDSETRYRTMVKQHSVFKNSKKKDESSPAPRPIPQALKGSQNKSTAPKSIHTPRPFERLPGRDPVGQLPGKSLGGNGARA